MDTIRTLVDQVDRRWRRQHHDEGALPEIADEVLRGADVGHVLEPATLIAHALRSGDLPEQDLGSTFGQPALRLHTTSRLQLEALFWLDGTTTVHQHAFSGAFRVLGGSSLHTRWHFEVDDRVSQDFLLGELRPRDHEVLVRGDTRPIAPGGGFIHSLFHLDRPSVTLVLRSHGSSAHEPQLTYLAPHVARNPFLRDWLVERRLQLLPSLRALVGDSEFRASVSELLEDSDLPATLHVLEKVQALLEAEDADPDGGASDLERLRPYLDAARRRHGTRVDRLEEVLAEKARKVAIIALRKRVHDAEGRFFLALVLNVPDRDAIIELLRARNPGVDPLDQVVRFARDLGGVSDESPDDGLAILRHLLDGHSGDALLARLRDDQGIDPADLEANRGAVEDECRGYRSSPLLRQLLRPGPAPG